MAAPVRRARLRLGRVPRPRRADLPRPGRLRAAAVHVGCHEPATPRPDGGERELGSSRPARHAAGLPHRRRSLVALPGARLHAAGDEPPHRLTDMTSLTTAAQSRDRRVQGAVTVPLTLSLIAGMVDVTSFLLLDGLFAAHVTGNVVVLAADVATGQPVRPAVVLAVFVFIAVTAV